MTTNEDNKEITTEEAARILNCSVRTIRNMIDRGSIKAKMYKVDPYIKKGRYRIPMSEIQRIQNDNYPR